MRKCLLLFALLFGGCKDVGPHINGVWLTDSVNGVALRESPVPLGPGCNTLWYGTRLSMFGGGAGQTNQWVTCGGGGHIQSETLNGTAEFDGDSVTIVYPLTPPVVVHGSISADGKRVTLLFPDANIIRLSLLAQSECDANSNLECIPK